jgi:phosphoribosylamine-glycine ligase
MRLAPLLALTIALTTNAFAEGEHQYVKALNSGKGVILWTDRLAATNCARATLRGTDQERRELCEDGTAGTKPKVGLLDAGTEVERLDPRACGDLVQVRVLDGPLTGGIGCISGGGLTRVRPQ